jgi:hypothetical protein
MLRDSSVRDVIDYLEYDVDPDVWIKRLLRQIETGTYVPSVPVRFTLAKSNGFTRTMTVPSVPDATLYRALVDGFYRRLRRYEVKHAYFERAALDAVQREAADQARREIEGDPRYPPTTRQRYLAWLKFDEYRRHLILERIYDHIVVADISNYFDSILHSRLSESLHRAGAQPATVGLLFFLIEHLSIRREHTGSPGIGLPVDELDCSRKLAHIFLFSHDQRMTRAVGSDAYVRWMDDQTIGVDTRAAGLRAIGELNTSLARLYLTASVAKSKLLTLSEARRHFHLPTNAAFREIDDGLKTRLPRIDLRADFQAAWNRALRSEGEGEWEKILKWAYRLAARLDVADFRDRSVNDLLAHPRLALRIADYMRATGSAAAFVDFAELVWNHNEQVYPDVNLALFEVFLRLEPVASTQKRIRKVATEILRGHSKLASLIATAAIAPLAILRFGDRRSLPLLARTFTDKPDELPAQTVRSAAVVYASYGAEQFAFVKRSAARILRHTLTDLVRFVDRIIAYDEVPARFKPRLELRFDAITGRTYFDMRSLLALRLLSLSRSSRVKKWVQQKTAELAKSRISSFDKRMIQRLMRDAV